MTVSLYNSRQPMRNEADGRPGPSGLPSAQQASPAASGADGGQEPLLRLAPSPVRRLVPRPEGLLQIHTAPFRGSFAAVFSQALRTAGLGSRVLISQFLKGGVEQGLEGSLWLCGRLQWLRPATLACLTEPALPLPSSRDDDPPAPNATSTATADNAGETSEALDPRLAVREVWDYSRRQLLEGSVDLLVLDELGLAVELGYLPAAEVTATLERRPAHLDVILTGPAMPPALMAMADQVTQLLRGTP
ncbi:MAG: cob(I)yrinic acid a,c-diamide adenosyltransferase [Synechococcaceae cyanobacterium]|nr:cob(I)yrinic acid a,c-diamide adenosyltransferase [Synechococcaceae cyanobacterium]